MLKKIMLLFAYHFMIDYLYPKIKINKPKNVLLHSITGLDSNLEAFNSHLIA